MAGYTHICSECGARLPVGEEHFGRRLRCARCRTEFAARPPAEEPSSSPAAEKPPEDEALTLPCLACGTMLKIRQELLGRKLRCPQCGHEFVPEIDSPPPEPDTPGTPPESVFQEPSPSTPPVPRSYTHVCQACDATLRVHERYYGKTLRCTTCRTEFEADPNGPSAAGDGSTEAAGYGGEGIAAPSSRFRFRRWMGVVAVVLVIIAAFLWWLGGNRQSGFGNEAFRVKKSRTDLGVLRNGGEPAVIVALDRETVDELIEALNVNNAPALRLLRESSRCVQLPAGTGVRVLERRKRSAATRVRVLDGPWSSRIVWVPVDWIE